MVSFTCSRCQDVVRKPKVAGHAAMCGSHLFTCVDCMKEFTLETIKSHTTCITEVDKYQGQWLKKKSGSSQSVRPFANSDGADESGRASAAPRRKVKRDISDTESDSDGDWVRQKKRSPCARPSAAVTKEKLQPAGAAATQDTAAAVAIATHTVSAPAAKIDEVAECVVPSFVLGTVTEVAGVVHDIVRDGGQNGWGEKAVAQELVRRYNKRIARAVRGALQAALTHGTLRCDDAGNIVPVASRH